MCICTHIAHQRCKGALGLMRWLKVAIHLIHLCNWRSFQMSCPQGNGVHLTQGLMRNEMHPRSPAVQRWGATLNWRALNPIFIEELALHHLSATPVPITLRGWQPLHLATPQGVSGVKVVSFQTVVHLSSIFDTLCTYGARKRAICISSKMQIEDVQPWA